MATSAIALGPWGRGQQGGGSLGNTNPFEMMSTLLDVRNKMQTFGAQQEAGQILATSPDMDTALETMRKSPNAAFMLPTINQIREGQLTQANIARAQAETGRAYVESGRAAAETIKDYRAMGMEGLFNIIRLAPAGDQAGMLASIDAFKASLPPGAAREVGPIIDNLRESLARPMSAGEFAMKQTGLLMGANLSPSQAYGYFGAPAPEIIKSAGPMGGPDVPYRVGGFLAPQPLFGGSAISGPAATTPQMNQWQELNTHKVDLDQSVNAGTALIQNVNEARRDLEKFTPGPLTPVRTQLAAIAKQFGFDDATVKDIAGSKNDIEAVQEFQKLAFTQIMSQLNQALPAGSRTNFNEYRDAVLSNPSPEMQKGAILKIFDYWQRTYLRGLMEQKYLTDYMTDHAGDPAAAAQWASKWNQTLIRKGLTGTDYYAPADKSLKQGDRRKIHPGDAIKLFGNPDAESRKVFDSDKAYGPGASSLFLDEGG